MDSRTLKMAKVFDSKGPVGHSGYLGGRDGQKRRRWSAEGVEKKEKRSGGFQLTILRNI
jgi:hypothetical protein